jgi:GxxExxY protein
MTENELAKIAVNSAYKIHKTFGPGLFEMVYKECIYFELTQQKILVEKEKQIPLIYSSVHLEAGYRADLILENKLIIEVKAIEAIHDVHFSQALTYLRLADCKLGLLINFNVPLIKDGIRRIVNNL